MTHSTTTLGELISVFYEELLLDFQDEELARVVAATLVNEMILDGNLPDEEIAAA